MGFHSFDDMNKVFSDTTENIYFFYWNSVMYVISFVVYDDAYKKLVYYCDFKLKTTRLFEESGYAA